MFRIIPWLFSIFTFVLVLIIWGPLKPFINIASALASIVLPLLLIHSIYSFYEIKQAFRHLFDSSDTGTSARQFRKSSQIFVAYGVLSFSIGILVTIFAVIAILSNLADPSAVAPNLANSLITIFYSLLVFVFISFPASNFLTSAANRAALADID